MIFERIQKFNQGRDPNLLALKYRLMQANAFTFFRATCHLFYEDWPNETLLNSTPSVWNCGDLHLENFGSYKGKDRKTYFDLNDFDETVLAPCTWDVARFVTSILVGFRSLGVNEKDILRSCHSFLETYRKTLATGQALSMEQETATGMVKDLLDGVKSRNRQAFLDERTKLTKNSRKLRIDNQHTQSVSDEERTIITECMAHWSSQQAEPEFFQLIDVAYRIAGSGSLGLKRYVLLIEGKGSPNQNYLVDLKLEMPSSLQPYVPMPQPQWASQADRVVAIQQRMQAVCPGLLTSIELADQTYVLRELQPSQDRLNLKQWNGKLQRLENVIKTMAQLTAWSQLRICGYRGSATVDQLIDFAKDDHWQNPLIEYAQTYSLRVEADYREFCKEIA